MAEHRQGIRRYRVTNPDHNLHHVSGVKPGETRNLRLTDQGRAKFVAAGGHAERILATVMAPIPGWMDPGEELAKPAMITGYIGPNTISVSHWRKRS